MHIDIHRTYFISGCVNSFFSSESKYHNNKKRRETRVTKHINPTKKDTGYELESVAE
jgi:hypothetical protein